ncbi:MAG: hypothetical protein SF066_19755 [Thermoanaerobaculia bacterium]|nr:hypothetical protein [Thermoanaerobaculia bacterium]
MAEDVEAKVETPLTGWAANLAMALGTGTGVLHAIGYVSLRFRLRALGVEMDHAMLDERFLFEGARCLLQLLTTVPLLVLLASPVVVLGVLLRRVPGLGRRIDGALLRVHGAPPRWLVVGGVAWAVLAVQFVMHHVIHFQNLLLDPVPCDPPWLRSVMLDGSGRLAPFYFVGLLALLAPTAFAFFRLPKTGWMAARGLLGLLLFVQVLLLPVHFGIVGAAAPLARIAEVPGEPATSRVWQAFATDDSAVFLIERPGPPTERRLVALKSEGLERLEVVGREAVLSRAEGHCGR